MEKSIFKNNPIFSILSSKKTSTDAFFNKEEEHEDEHEEKTAEKAKKTSKRKTQFFPGSVKQVQLPPVWQLSKNNEQKQTEKEDETTSFFSLTKKMLSPNLKKEEQKKHVEKQNSKLSSAPQIKTVTVEEEEEDPQKDLQTNKTTDFRTDQFELALQSEVIDLEHLRQLSWRGIPAKFRPITWKLLLGYLPSKESRRVSMLDRKRQEYFDYLQQYYYIDDTARESSEQDTLHQILVDIPRSCSDLPLFKDPLMQKIMERILYIWAIRHPASGYVQGINDILAPFLLVFLSEIVDNVETVQLDTVENLSSYEADCYWCLAKLLDDIQDHYTFAQPGVQRLVFKMEELVARCDEDLHDHLVQQLELQFVQFSFRWMNCLLLREIPLHLIVRLWDTYLSEQNGFETFHLYVCAALLMTFKEKLKSLTEFHEVLIYLQKIPTELWDEDEIEQLLSRAFILQSYFQDAPNHLN